MANGRLLAMGPLGLSVLLACGSTDSTPTGGGGSGGTASHGGSTGSTATAGPGGNGGSASSADSVTSSADSVSSAAASGGGGAGGTGGGPPVPLPALKVVGTELQDEMGKTIILRGSSLMDIGTLYTNGGKSVSGIIARMEKVTAAGLEGHTVRLPVYPKINYNSGFPYCSPQPYPVGTGPSASCKPSDSTMTEDEYIGKVLKPAVDYATSRNLYVIVDYHQMDDATKGTAAADATTFWKKVAPAFANYANVLYEPFNEPIDLPGSWAALKPFVQEWIDTIRASAPNNVIIVPSPIWAQLPGDAASDPPKGTNLMYTAHVYPGNWNDDFKNQVATAVKKAPVFFTEWGYDLNGSSDVSGTTDTNWGKDFRAVLDANGASWTAWVTDAGWMPRLFAGPQLTTLTPFGTFTKQWLADKANSDWVH